MSADSLVPARLRPADMARVAERRACAPAGCAARCPRSGIAIGVAAIVAVLGPVRILAGRSARRDRPARHEPAHRHQRQTASSATPRNSRLAAPSMIAGSRRSPRWPTPARSACDAYRSPYIPAIHTNALSVQAASLDLPPAVGTTVAAGSWLNAATAEQPVCRARRGRRPTPRHRPGPSRRADLGRTTRGSTSPASSTPPCSPPRSTARSWSASRPPSTT